MEPADQQAAWGPRLRPGRAAGLLRSQLEARKMLDSRWLCLIVKTSYHKDSCSQAGGVPKTVLKGAPQTLVKHVHLFRPQENKPTYSNL